MCAVVWVVSLLIPHYGRDSLAFLPFLAVFGVAQTVIIMRYVDTAGPEFQKLWVGCACGAVNAGLALLIFYVAMAVEPALKGDARKIVVITGLILPFVLPPVLSPRILAVFMPKRPA